MIKLLSKIPKGTGNQVHGINVAVSGGVDSMVAYYFLKNGGHPVFPVFVHHGTEDSEKAFQFFDKHFRQKHIHYIRGEKPKDQSSEEFWRNERNKFFRSLGGPVITGHHLDDAIETWVWSSLHGNPRLPNYYNGIVYRPFLLNPKSELIKWALDHDIPWIEDESNEDVGHPRNRIRHNLMPEIRQINPGIEKVVRKKIIASIKEEDNE